MLKPNGLIMRLPQLFWSRAGSLAGPKAQTLGTKSQNPDPLPDLPLKKEQVLTIAPIELHGATLVPPNSVPLQTAPAQISSSDNVVVHSNPRSAAADRFRLLQMRLEGIQSSRGTKRLLITSPLPEEGKSTIALNLATVLSKYGRRSVLLVEADVYRPSLCKKLGLDPWPGLTDCHRNMSDPSTTIRRIEPFGFHLAPAGLPSEDPDSLLPSNFVAQFLERMSAEFDWILIDSPPTIPVAEILALKTRADATLLVVRAGKTQREAVEEAIQVLGRDHIVGIVLNAVEGLEQAYSRYYGYVDAEAQSKSRVRLQVLQEHAAASWQFARGLVGGLEETGKRYVRDANAKRALKSARESASLLKQIAVPLEDSSARNHVREANAKRTLESAPESAPLLKQIAVSFEDSSAKKSVAGANAKRALKKAPESAPLPKQIAVPVEDLSVKKSMAEATAKTALKKAPESAPPLKQIAASFEDSSAKKSVAEANAKRASERAPESAPPLQQIAASFEDSSAKKSVAEATAKTALKKASKSTSTLKQIAVSFQDLSAIVWRARVEPQPETHERPWLMEPDDILTQLRMRTPPQEPRTRFPLPLVGEAFDHNLPRRPILVLTGILTLALLGSFVVWRSFRRPPVGIAPVSAPGLAVEKALQVPKAVTTGLRSNRRRKPVAASRTASTTAPVKKEIPISVEGAYIPCKMGPTSKPRDGKEEMGGTGAQPSRGVCHDELVKEIPQSEFKTVINLTFPQ